MILQNVLFLWLFTFQSTCFAVHALEQDDIGHKKYPFCKPGSFKGNVFCTQHNATVFAGHCLGYINSSISRKLGVQSVYDGLVLSRCPYYAGSKIKNLKIKISTNSSLPTRYIADEFCKSVSDGHRNGLLCGKCAKNYGISVLSPNYECKNCSKYNSTTRNTLYLFGFTALPLTILIIIIVVFHIGLTSASTNAYIFFSHVITTKLSILIIESAWALSFVSGHKEDDTHKLPEILFFPLYIWNLDFSYYTPAIHVACITENTHIVSILCWQYFFVLYPMILLLLAWILVYLHGRNCKVVVALWKPFCYLCVRIRRNWNVQTSLIDAFATCILLSYSKLIDVSLSFTSPNPVYNSTGDTIYYTLHYDVNTVFFSSKHLPFFIVGTVMLTFGLAFPLFLILYPFRWFQKLMNVLHINRFQSLHIFLDAFQGCYKNGTNGTPERRYFAGLYFLLRLVVLFALSFGVFTITIATNALATIYAVFLCLIAILQPYKENFYNILDSLIFLILTITSANTLYILNFAVTNDKISPVNWPFTYALLLLPSTYMLFYILYWILTRFRARCCRQCCKQRGRRYFRVRERRLDTVTEASETSPLHTSLDHICDSFPHRVTNPHLYTSPNQGIFKCHSINEQEYDGSPMAARYGAVTY